CGVGQLTASGLRTRSFIDHETSARKPPRNCKVGGEKARRKEARQIIVGARQLVRGHRPAGAVPSGTRGRHTPVLAHQLASAREKILALASWCAGNARKRPSSTSLAARARGVRDPDANGPVPRCAATLLARPMPTLARCATERRNRTPVHWRYRAVKNLGGSNLGLFR